MIGLGVLLAGCAVQGPSASLNSAGAQELLALPLPEYAAKIRLARQVAADCPRYSYNDQLQVDLSAARPDTARGSLEALRQRGGIDLATDVEMRSFQAKHRLTVGASDLCDAADAEVAQGTAIGVFLVSAR
jgi:hypothetical protein